MNIKWNCVYRVFGANMAQGLSLGECQSLSLALYVAHGLHHPRTYLSSQVWKKLALGKPLRPSIISMATGYVVVVQENLLGTALRELRGEGATNHQFPVFYFLS